MQYIVIIILTAITSFGCSYKAAPIPHKSHIAEPCYIKWSIQNILEVALPNYNIMGSKIKNLEKLHIYHLPLNKKKPTQYEILTKGRVILNYDINNLLIHNNMLKLDLRCINCSSGWITVIVSQTSSTISRPSNILFWLNE